MAPVMENASVYAQQQLDDALASQKMEGAVKLVVKNTFFDVDGDVPGMEDLQRSLTAPPHMVRAQAEIDCGWDTEEEEDAPLTGHTAHVVASIGDITCSASPADDLSATPQHDFKSHHGLFPSASAVSDPYGDFSAGFPANQVARPAACLQPYVGQWLAMKGEEFSAFVQVQRPSAYLSAEAQTGYPLPALNRQAFNGEQQFAMMPEFAPRVPHMAAALPVDPLAQEWEVLEEAPQPFQPQTLNQYRSLRTGATCISWTVDAKKLRSNDRLTVSPLFKVCDGHFEAPPLPFKMIISPKVASDGKGGSSFGKAKGKAIIQLKCEAPREEFESNPITFYLSADSGRQENLRQHPARGPITHNFAKSGVCGLPKECDIWDFLDIVDEPSKTFVVRLEILPAQH